MAQYLKPDSAQGYIEDNAEIEFLKFNNLRHVVLGCLLGDYNDVGEYVVDPEIVNELISMEKYIFQTYDNIEVCKSILKLDKQISFMVTFEGNKATLSLIEKLNYEANFAINSGTYSNINEYVLETVETSGEINRNVLYARWNIKPFPSNIIDIFSCDDSVLEKYFGICNRFKYLLNANTVLLQKEEKLEEIEAEYANELLTILSHYPKLESVVIKTVKEMLAEKQKAVSVKKPYFAKTFNEVLENAIQQNIGVLEEKEKIEFNQEKRNVVVATNIKRKDVLDVQVDEYVVDGENNFEQKIITITIPSDTKEKSLTESAREFVKETNKVQKQLNANAKAEEFTSDLIQRLTQRVKESKQEHSINNEQSSDQANGKSEKTKLINTLLGLGLSEAVGLEKNETKKEESVKDQAGVQNKTAGSNANKTAKKPEVKKADKKAKKTDKKTSKKPAKKDSKPAKKVEKKEYVAKAEEKPSMLHSFSTSYEPVNAPEKNPEEREIKQMFNMQSSAEIEEVVKDAKGKVSKVVDVTQQENTVAGTLVETMLDAKSSDVKDALKPEVDILKNPISIGTSDMIDTLNSTQNKETALNEVLNNLTQV